MERRERAAFDYAVQRCVKRRFPVAHMSGVRHRKWGRVRPMGKCAQREKSVSPVDSQARAWRRDMLGFCQKHPQSFTLRVFFCVVTGHCEATPLPEKSGRPGQNRWRQGDCWGGAAGCLYRSWCSSNTQIVIYISVYAGSRLICVFFGRSEMV